MFEIAVSLREPSEQGHLIYERDPEIEGDIVFVKNLQRRKMIYGVNLNAGHAILSFNAKRVLQSVEFIYRWKAWHKVPRLEVPHPAQGADVVLVGVQAAPEEWQMPTTRMRHDNILSYNYEFEPGVYATTDENYSAVQFLFGESGTIGEWVALSHQCFALIAGGFLRGFFVQLANAPLRQPRPR